MNVSFLLKTPPGGKEAVEYVSIKASKALDTVVRVATNKDRSRHSRAYAAFRAAQSQAAKAKPKG